MRAPSKHSYPPWRKGDYTDSGIKVTSPGIEWYAKEIVSGVPFSMVRYGEGEWRTVVPGVALKPFHNREVYREIWHSPQAIEHLTRAVVNHHRHPRYFAAMWHIEHLRHYFHWLPSTIKWQKKNGLGDVRWHDGWVWRRAVQSGTFYPIVKAIKEQSLPLCIVGPPSLSRLNDHFDVEYRVEIDRWKAYYQLDLIVESVRHFNSPALWIICGGGPAKIAINRLFPELCEISYLIDFGAVWEGMLGERPRSYYDYVSGKTMRRNWHGE